MSLIKNILETYVTNSNEALEFKLVRKVEDLEKDEDIFRPEMSHQVFGENESIFGYKDLRVKLYYTAGKMKPYLGISFIQKIDPVIFDGCKPDEIEKRIAEFLQPGFCTNLDSFSTEIQSDSDFLPIGELMHSFSVQDENNPNSVKTFEIYKCDVNTPGLKSYHERIQTFVLWYIDAASFIDIDDDHWRFFLLYEKFSQDNSSKYAFCGYSTIYEYYAYPFNIRPRISQMLILPPFQHCGLGTELLTSVYKMYAGSDKVLDITVEDPSENFQRIRDYVDSKNCLSLPSFQVDKLKSGFSKDMVNEARSKFKINKRQVRRLFEILRLKATNINNEEEYRTYRLLVKNRLNIPYKKEERDMKRLEAAITKDELKGTMAFTSLEQRLENLEKEYRAIESEYLKVVQRLST